MLYRRYAQFRLFDTMEEPASPDANQVRRGSGPRFKVVIIHVICGEFHHFLSVQNLIINYANLCKLNFF
jgi:hypothetical protein